MINPQNTPSAAPFLFENSICYYIIKFFKRVGVNASNLLMNYVKSLLKL